MNRMSVEQYNLYAKQCKEHNKHLRAKYMHSQQMTTDEYITYVRNTTKPVKQEHTKRNKLNWNPPVRTTREVQSYSNGIGNVTKSEPRQYTGERRLLGIATMHKSNLVPVFDDEEGKKQAKELAKMRR